MIEVESLTKKYGDLVAIRELNFKVEKGKIWGILGPNAAGKTTTMRILTGYLPATDGKASIGGFDVFELLSVIAAPATTDYFKKCRREMSFI